jgi:polyphosphate kinase
MKEMLRDRLGLEPGDVYETIGPLDLSAMMRLASTDGRPDLAAPDWRPATPASLQADEEIWETLRKGDILLHHPYESFDPVVRMVVSAADDPRVLAIKMTLYRTSGDSPIVAALERAAAKGKQVAVLVELKARFDEAQNIEWAGRLERAGGIVVYGVSGLKVHAKALLVVRREDAGVTRYLHLGTGNYNDKTARLYTDFSLMTAHEQLTFESGLFFNAITGYSSVPALRSLVMAPMALKPKIVELIRREAERSTPDAPGRIVAKMNSLCEPDVIEALYAASQRGTRIDLIVRGICTLVPGVPGLSETIGVISVVDRFLEHSRIFYFQNGGAEEVFLASADWMPRNLERRVELMFPVTDTALRDRLVGALETHLADNCQAHELASNGTYQRRHPDDDEKPVRSQEQFYHRAIRRSELGNLSPRREFTVRRRPPADRRS